VDRSDRLAHAAAISAGRGKNTGRRILWRAPLTSLRRPAAPRDLLQ
jgi:hypothetical protein